MREKENIKIKMELNEEIDIEDLTNDTIEKIIDNIKDYITCGYDPADVILIEDETCRDLMRKIIVKLYERFI